jgi:CopG family nickel-responsive transcriptional regulator
VHHGKLNLISVEQHQPHRHARHATGVTHLHLKPAT